MSPSLRLVAVPFLARLAACAALLLLAASARGQDDGIWNVYLYANEVRALAAVGEDVFAATSGGVVRWREGEPTQWTRRPLGVLSDSLRTVAADGSGNLWFGTERAGISILDPAAEAWFPFTSLLEPIPGDRVRKVRIQEDDEGREVILVAAEQGYSWFVDGDLRFVCQSGVDICGLPSYDVYDLLLFGDELWIATAGGLVAQQEDGTWIPRPAQPAIRVLAADAGAVLAAGGDVVLRWADEEWVDVSLGLPDGVVVNQILSADGEVWLAAEGGGGGVFRWVAGAGWTRLGTEIFPATAIARTASGRIFAGAADVNERRDGVWEWDGAVWRQHRTAGPSLRAVYRSAHVDPTGVLWFSAAQGGRSPLVGSFDGASWTIRNGGENGALRAWTWSILGVGDELYLAHCCCNEGEDLCRLESFDGEDTFRSFAEVQEIWALELDEDGYLWAATNHGNESQSKGLYRIDPVTREHELFDRDRLSLPSNQIPAVRVDDRVAWIGTFGDGLLRWDFGADGVPQGTTSFDPASDDAFRLYTATGGLPGERLIGNSIRRIEIGDDGRVWIGTTTGISIYENGVFTNLEARFDRFPTAEVTALALDSGGGAWVATRDAGVTRMVPDPEGGFVYRNYQAPLLPNPNVNALALTPDERTVWLATARGLASFTPFGSGGGGAVAGVVAAYPNPFVIGCGDGIRLRGAGGLSSGTVVDLDGRKLASFEDVAESDLVWDGRAGGAPVAAGLYIVRVQSPTGIRSVAVAILDGDCPR